MNRRDLLKLAYNRGEDLSVRKSGYRRLVKSITGALLRDDLGKAGDITSKIVLAGKINKLAVATVIAKQRGRVAGVEETIWFLGQHGVETKALIRDGDKVEPGDQLIKLTGKLKQLLKLERVGMNLLQRLSGIATATDKLTKKAAPLLVAATRKTQWAGMDNKAVSVGGGVSHRLGLWEAILIKDNHLEIITIEKAIERALKENTRAVFVEIEVGSQSEAIRAAIKFKKLQETTEISDKPNIIMLDNFSAKQARETVAQLKRKGCYQKALIEASGGITAENILEYKDSGVDVVSLGALTHSAKVLDLSLKINYEKK